MLSFLANEKATFAYFPRNHLKIQWSKHVDEEKYFFSKEEIQVGFWTWHPVSSDATRTEEVFFFA